MKRFSKNVLQKKQTVKTYAACTNACQSSCVPIPTEAMASSGAFQANSLWNK